MSGRTVRGSLGIALLLGAAHFASERDLIDLARERVESESATAPRGSTDHVLAHAYDEANVAAMGIMKLTNASAVAAEARPLADLPTAELVSMLRQQYRDDDADARRALGSIEMLSTNELLAVIRAPKTPRAPASTSAPPPQPSPPRRHARAAAAQSVPAAAAADALARDRRVAVSTLASSATATATDQVGDASVSALYGSGEWLRLVGGGEVEKVERGDSDSTQTARGDEHNVFTACDIRALNRLRVRVLLPRGDDAPPLCGDDIACAPRRVMHAHTIPFSFTK